jgi:hypothetical protein
LRTPITVFDELGRVCDSYYVEPEALDELAGWLS